MRVLIEWAGRKGCAHMLCGCFSKKMAVDEFVAQPKEEESLSASSGEEEDDDDESSSTESEERRRDAALQRRALGHLGHQSLALPWRSWQEAARARARSGRVRPRKEPRKPSLKLAEPEVRPPKRKSVVTRLLLPPRRGAPIIRV